MERESIKELYILFMDSCDNNLKKSFLRIYEAKMSQESNKDLTFECLPKYEWIIAKGIALPWLFVKQHSQSLNAVINNHLALMVNMHSALCDKPFSISLATIDESKYPELNIILRHTASRSTNFA